MPAEFPGFYWDEARNRYFPLSSKPKALTLARPPPSPPPIKSKESNITPTRHLKRKRRNDLWNTTELSRTLGYSLRGHQTSQSDSFDRVMCAELNLVFMT